MNLPLRRFFASLALLLLIVFIFVAIEARHTLINPDTNSVIHAENGSLIIYRNKGKVCLFIDEQTSKPRALVSVRVGGKAPFLEPVYTSVVCKADKGNGILSCSDTFILHARLYNPVGDPSMRGVVQTYSDPIYLPAGSYRTYVGSEAVGELDVSYGDGRFLSSTLCKDFEDNPTFFIPYTPTAVPPERKTVTFPENNQYPEPINTPEIC